MSLSLPQLCLVFLLLTKIPDFTTTWKGLEEHPTTEEQNPIARSLFEKIGIVPTFFLASRRVYQALQWFYGRY